MALLNESNLPLFEQDFRKYKCSVDKQGQMVGFLLTAKHNKAMLENDTPEKITMNKPAPHMWAIT